MSNSIRNLFPTPDLLLQASETELEWAVLQNVSIATDDKFRRFITRDGVAISLFEHGGYECPHTVREEIRRRVSRAWKILEDSDLLEEPDSANGKNGYRIISSKGRAALADVDFAAAKARNAFTRAMFPLLPDAAWNAFRAGDYDTAVFESFKAVEISVRKKGNFSDTDFGVTLMTKAFDPNAGALRDQGAPASRRNARQRLFEGALGEIRNPKAHNDQSIRDTLVAVEEMMTANMLLRIVAAI